MKVSMATIAEAAGCSRITVSKALRNARDISEKRRNEIQALAREMGYRPNPMVSALMASRASRGGLEHWKGTLGVISNWPKAEKGKVDWHRLPNVQEQVDGIRERATDLGFKVEFFSLAGGDYSAKRLHQILSTRGILGLILLPSPDYSEALKLPFKHYCVSAIGAQDAIRHIQRASTNRFDNMLMTLKELEHLGYQRPGLALTIGSEQFSYFHYHGAFLAYMDTRQAKGNRLPVLLMEHQNDKEALMQWLQTNHPDVVIGDIALLEHLKSSGIEVPEDVAFVMIDVKKTHPDVAGFDSNLKTLGAAVVDLVTAQLNRNEFGLSRNPPSVLISGTWCPGATCPQKKSLQSKGTTS